MQDILSNLPGKDQITDLLQDEVNIDGLGADTLSDFEVDRVGAEMKGVTQDIPSAPESVDLPEDLNAETLRSSITDRVDAVKSVEPNALFSGLTDGLSYQPDAQPNFDISGVVNEINGQLIPSSVTGPPSSASLAGVPDFMAPLRELAASGLATPMKLLNIWLKVVESIGDTLGDADQIKEITRESFLDIYRANLSKLESKIPLSALDSILILLTVKIDEKTFIDLYTDLLNHIETADLSQSETLNELYNALSALTPTLQKIRELKATLNEVGSAATDELNALLEMIVNFAQSDKVLLQDFYDAIGSAAATIFGGAAQPVAALGDMADDINAFLIQVADTADGVSDSLEAGILGKVRTAFAPIYQLATVFDDIEDRVVDFFGSISMDDVIDTYKKTYHGISQKIETFLFEVEVLKIKLEAGITKITANVNGEITKQFEAVETKIEEMLGRINTALESGSVKTSLEKAKGLIDTCTTVIEDSSVKPVFDYTVDKTVEAGEKIASIDTSGTGIPERVALKMGVKVIKHAQIDQIVKEELYEIFQSLQKPLKELVDIIEDSIGGLETRINQFEPGTIVDDYVRNSAPYKQLLEIVQMIKPSTLLAPIEDAYQMISDEMKSLDPDIFIDQLIKAFDSVKGLLNGLDFDQLNALIGDGFDQIRHKFEQLSDNELAAIVDTLKQTLSIEKLVESSGLTQVADSEFWQLLKNIFSGNFLNGIETAITNFGADLGQIKTTFDLTPLVTDLQALCVNIENQAAATVDIIQTRLTEVRDEIENQRTHIEVCLQKRHNLLTIRADDKVLVQILVELDLQPLLDLSSTLTNTLDLTNETLSQGLTAFNTALNGKLDDLKAITSVGLQNALPGIYDTQLGDPAKALITDIRGHLTPYAETLDKLEGIIDTLTVIPGKIDASFDKIADTLLEGLKQAVLYILGGLEGFALDLAGRPAVLRDAIVDLLDRFDPYWLFNCFSIYDFYGAEAVLEDQSTTTEVVKQFGLKINDAYTLFKQTQDPQEKRKAALDVIGRIFKLKEGAYVKITQEGNVAEDDIIEKDENGRLIFNEINDDIGKIHFKFGDYVLQGNPGGIGDKYLHRNNVEYSVDELKDKVDTVDTHITENIYDESLKVRKVTIYGFCDPVGSTSYNVDFLAPARIGAVKKHLKNPQEAYPTFKEYDPHYNFVEGYCENKNDPTWETLPIGEDLWQSARIESKAGDPEKRFAAMLIEAVGSVTDKKYVITGTQGILAIAAVICKPAGDPIAQLLQSKVSADRLDLLKQQMVGDITDENFSLSAGNCETVIDALNALLVDNTLTLETHYNVLNNKLSQLLAGLNTQLDVSREELLNYTQEEIEARVTLLMRRHRISVLLALLERTRGKYLGAAVKRNYLIRYNRIYLEAYYIDDIRFSIQSLFPLIMAVVADLFPSEIIADLDELWATIAEEIEELPTKLLATPLNNVYKAVKDKLLSYFDVDDVFKALSLKLTDMDAEVDSGLNRISSAYTRMLDTLDKKLS